MVAIRVPKSVIAGLHEIYGGPMSSGKSKALLDRWYIFNAQSELIPFPIDVFKPRADTRDKNWIKTRAFSGYGVRGKFFRTEYPGQILDMVSPGPGVVFLDEIQFVLAENVLKGTPDMYSVIEKLLEREKHVISGGLTHDFRGEYFGDMGRLINKPGTIFHELFAICHCGELATRTQRYNVVNKKRIPAHYNDLIVMPGDKAYEAVCLEHHLVPGRPGTDLQGRLLGIRTNLE